jgi:hypothetical protein
MRYTGRGVSRSSRPEPHAAGRQPFQELGGAAKATAAYDAKPGETFPPDVKNDTEGVNTSSLTREGSIDPASLDWSMETSANGVTGRLRVTMKVNPCPDTCGQFTATATLTASFTPKSATAGSVRFKERSAAQRSRWWATAPTR